MELADGPTPSGPWTPEQLKGPRVRLDFTSASEMILMIALATAGVTELGVGGTGLILGVSGDPAAGVVLRASLGYLLLAVLPLTAAFKALDVTLVLDNRARRIELLRRFGPLVRVSPVADFDQVAVVGVLGVFWQGKSRTWWEYCPALVLKDERLVTVGDEVRRDVQVANARAKVLADHLRVRFVPGNRECSLRLAAGSRPGVPKVEVARESASQPWWLVPAALVSMLLAAAPLVLAIAWGGPLPTAAAGPR